MINLRVKEKQHEEEDKKKHKETKKMFIRWYIYIYMFTGEGNYKEELFWRRMIYMYPKENPWKINSSNILYHVLITHKKGKKKKSIN